MINTALRIPCEHLSIFVEVRGDGQGISWWRWHGSSESCGSCIIHGILGKGSMLWDLSESTSGPKGQWSATVCERFGWTLTCLPDIFVIQKRFETWWLWLPVKRYSKLRGILWIHLECLSLCNLLPHLISTNKVCSNLQDVTRISSTLYCT